MFAVVFTFQSFLVPLRRYVDLFIIFKDFFLYLIWGAVVGLHCCARAFSSCSEWGLLFVLVCGLLIVVASLTVEDRL